MRRSKSTRREVLKIAGATALGVSAAPGDAAAQVLGCRPCGRGFRTSFCGALPPRRIGPKAPPARMVAARQSGTHSPTSGTIKRWVQRKQ